MKKSISIILFSSLAILLVVAIEIILVNRIYKLETEKFTYSYREVLQKGLSYMDNRGRQVGLNAAYYSLELQSIKAIPFYESILPDTLKFKEIVLTNFQKTLEQKQVVDSLLRLYLKKMKMEPGFQSVYVITSLALLNNNKIIPVFDHIRDSSWSYPDTLKVKPNQLPITHYTYYGNNFQMGIDYYIDFDNKKELVLKQITGSLLIALLALAIVCFVFMVTMRNLMEERRLSQLKTDFINNMTHELKTPLSTISIATRTLENDSILDDRSKIKETVSVIRRQNKQLTQQINHLLEISMWERNQFSLNRQPVELEPFFSGIAEAFRWECKDKTCNLQEKFTFAKTTAILDESQMTIALHNLLINAIKYNDKEPEVVFEVSCDDRLRIAISDNGIGIGKEDQKHIFDKFYRVSTGNVHKVKGLGLGLFYVKQIIDAHGGTIEVMSRPGKGSTFIIILPLNGKNQNSAG